MSLAIRNGLYASLLASATVKAVVGERIYHGQAPSSAAFPFIIFHKQAGTPTYDLKSTGVKSETWLVKVVDRNTSSKAEEGMEAADAVLNLGTITVSGSTLLDLRAQSDVDYLENDGDQQFRHHGRLYRVTVA